MPTVSLLPLPALFSLVIEEAPAVSLSGFGFFFINESKEKLDKRWQEILNRFSSFSVHVCDVHFQILHPDIFRIIYRMGISTPKAVNTSRQTMLDNICTDRVNIHFPEWRIAKVFKEGRILPWIGRHISSYYICIYSKWPARNSVFRKN